MEDWEIVSIEMELDRLRDEKENSKIVPAATGAKVGCFSILLYVILGILIFRIFIEVISILSR
jgi:hypothetical protein